MYRKRFVRTLRYSHEKSKDEMHFDKCDVEPEEILPLI